MTLPATPMNHAGASTAWTPPLIVTTHAGTPIETDVDFFAPPPPEIGRVLTADSTLHQGVQPRSIVARILIAMCVMVGINALVAAVVFAFIELVASDAHSADRAPFGPAEYIAVFAFQLPGIFAGLCYLLTGFQHTCSYVGTLGLAHYTLRGNRSCSEGNAFQYVNASELRSSQTPLYTSRGNYSRTEYEYNWRDLPGNVCFSIKGNYCDFKPRPRLKYDIWFAISAERVWTDWLARTAKAELTEDDFVQFNIGARQWIRVGKGFLELGVDSASERLPRDDIKRFLLHKGCFVIDTNEVRQLGLRGSHVIRYEQIGNARLFILTVEKLLGYQLLGDEWRDQPALQGVSR
jgi:hypothetical protein